MIEIKIKKLAANAATPSYATDGAGCFDIRATANAVIDARKQSTIPTGLAFEIPPGHAMLVYSRSGHGFKHGLRLANGTGIIDSDYRGELMVALRNDSDTPYLVSEGERIAQAMIVPLPKVIFAEVAELSETERGDGGLGSTGKC